MSFARFTDLPRELQAYILSFLPVQVLVKSVAPTCKQNKRLVDGYVQGCVCAGLSGLYASGERGGVEEGCTLLFEAQRPIDTLTSRHRLFFSHLEYAQPAFNQQNFCQEAYTLLAHFDFVPTVDIQDEKDEQREQWSKNDVATHDAYDGPSSYVQGRHGRRRTNTRSGTRPWGFWSEPVTSSLAAIDGMGRRRSTSRDDGARQASLARREVHYNIMRGGKKAFEAPPTYRFQLDSLDSFETWILSLTMQRMWYQRVATVAIPSSSSFDGTHTPRGRPVERRTATALKEGSGTSTPIPVVRPMRWEKRVVEGLDRVFRHWFSPCYENEQMSAVLEQEQQNFSDDTSTSSASPSSSPSIEKLSFSWTGRIPDERELELDGQCCTLRIQPHINEQAEAHPALTSMSSHYYLSSAPSLAMPSQSDGSTDFTFHCTALQLNAARLLSVMEDIDEQMERSRAAVEASAVLESSTVSRQSQLLSSGRNDDAASSPFVILSGQTSSGVSWSDVMR